MTRLGTMPDARALRIHHRQKSANETERDANRGLLPQYHLHADDLLPPPRSIPWSIGAPKHRDWSWLLEVWLDKPDSPERDRMIQLCRQKLAANES